MLATRAEIPLPVLRDTIAQFPTFSEAFATALPDERMLVAMDHAPHPMIGEPA